MYLPVTWPQASRNLTTWKGHLLSKLLWHSNAPWAPTGYGMQTALFTPWLRDHYDLAISSFYGLEGAPLVWEDIPVFPGTGGDFGNESLVRHATQFFDGDPRGGLVLTLMDVWVLDTDWVQQMNVASWVPVDHDPAPQPVTEFFMKTNAIPIAMSRFGEAMLGRLDPLYVPHGVDTKRYRPFDRREVRREVGLPEDCFLVGMVAANKGRPSRKSFAEALQAFAKLAAAHEDVYLYLHTMVGAGHARGEDLPALLDALGVPKERVTIADQYRVLYEPYSHNQMAKVYSAMDVLLNPSMGEGFGIPVLEAQACGVPAIVTDFSAMTEVCGVGWHVGYDRAWTGQNSWMASPHVSEITDALEDCYGQPASLRAKGSAAAVKHAQQYDVRRVLKQHWLPALRTIERRFGSQEPIRIPPRARVAA